MKFTTQRKQKIPSQKIRFKKHRFFPDHLQSVAFKALQFNAHLQRIVYEIKHLPYDAKLAKYGENVDRAKNRKNQAQLNIKRDNWRKTCTKITNFANFGRRW